MSRRDKSGSKYTILCMPSQVISLEVPASETRTTTNLWYFHLSSSSVSVSVRDHKDVHRQVGFNDPPATLPLRKLTSPTLTLGSPPLLLRTEPPLCNRADETARRDILFVLFPGDRCSTNGTRRGPDEFFPRIDVFPPPSDARACGDSCGIMLDRLRGRSLRIGPMFDRRRALFAASAALGVMGTRFAGLLWCRSRALPVVVVDELLESPDGDETRFMLRSMSGPMPPRRGEPKAARCSSSSSARLPRVEPLDRDLRNPGSRRLARGRLAPPRMTALAEDVDAEADDDEGPEKMLKSRLVSVFSSSHSLSDPPTDMLRVDDSAAGIENELELALALAPSSAGVTEITTGADAEPSPPSSRSPCPA